MINWKNFPISFLYRASIDNNFISENGIVAVLGDENQLVSGDSRKISRPLSFERGHLDQMRGSEAYLLNVTSPGASRSIIDSFI